MILSLKWPPVRNILLLKRTSLALLGKNPPMKKDVKPSFFQTPGATPMVGSKSFSFFSLQSRKRENHWIRRKRKNRTEEEEDHRVRTFFFFLSKPVEDLTTFEAVWLVESFFDYDIFWIKFRNLGVLSNQAPLDATMSSDGSTNNRWKIGCDRS